ncbi:MAG: hypothetical protein M3Z05_10805 [Gemmatimonadota bacterium]|nr:hypothetical protein [Gemmatimonadota bacterium]
MKSELHSIALGARRTGARALSLLLVFGLSSVTRAQAPNPDPRIGLRAGLMDAAEATWNMRVLSRTAPSTKFVGSTNSDLAFKGNYVIQGSYNGYQIWDISNPAAPSLRLANYCPASQSDVSVYKNLLFVSAEGNTGRIDCGDQGVKETVSDARIKGVRIFDITDIEHPRNVANVQTCRGSHTHTVVVDPKDKDNVYIYVSGSSSVRPEAELHGCSDASPDKDPSSAHFRIEAIKVPLAHPERAAIVTSPRIFDNLAASKSHGSAPDDVKAMAEAKARGAYFVNLGGNEMMLPEQFVKPMLDSIVMARGGTGAATGADSLALRGGVQAAIEKRFGGGAARVPSGPDQCHDITVYPAVGYAGGACGGYGLLLDIRDPAHPVRLDAAADTNFSYWHSATFNNDGTKVLFSDEWGGGGAPKCRATDPMEWGGDAIFTIENGKMKFKGYYKMPAAQTAMENCVAHNGSLIPIPGRDVMVQAWYQGGVSVFDWTDPAHAKEIAFFDRGPVDSTHFTMGGSWSVYWYNGVMVSSEIARGLDILELTPSQYISQNEIDAAKTVHLDYLNAQGQPKFVWPASYSLSRSYLDQIERMNALPAERIRVARAALDKAEKNASNTGRHTGLTALAKELESQAKGRDPKVATLAASVRELAGK